MPFGSVVFFENRDDFGAESRRGVEPSCPSSFGISRTAGGGRIRRSALSFRTPVPKRLPCSHLRREIGENFLVSIEVQVR